VIFLGQVEAMGYTGHVFFLPGADNTHSNVTALSNATGGTSSNGNTEHANRQGAPLIYFQGEYHRLASHYHHPHPELVEMHPEQ